MDKPNAKFIVLGGVFVLFLTTIIVCFGLLLQSRQRRLDRDIAIAYFQTRLSDRFTSHTRDLQSEKTSTGSASGLFSFPIFVGDDLYISLGIESSFEVSEDDVKFAKMMGKIDNLFVDELEDGSRNLVELLQHIQARFVLVSGSGNNQIDLSWMNGCGHPIVLNISDVRGFQNLANDVVEKLYLTDVDECSRTVSEAIDCCPNLKEIRWKNCPEMAEAYDTLSQLHPGILFREME